MKYLNNNIKRFTLLWLFLAQVDDNLITEDTSALVADLQEHLPDMNSQPYLNVKQQLVEADLIDAEENVTGKGAALCLTMLNAQFASGKYERINFEKLVAGKRSTYLTRLIDTASAQLIENTNNAPLTVDSPLFATIQRLVASYSEILANAVVPALQEQEIAVVELEEVDVEDVS